MNISVLSVICRFALLKESRTINNMIENDAKNGIGDGTSQGEVKVNPLHDLIAGGVAGSASVIVGRKLYENESIYCYTRRGVTSSSRLPASSFFYRSFRYDKGSHSNFQQ